MNGITLASTQVFAEHDLVRDGFLTIDGEGRIARLSDRGGDADFDLGDVAIIPGLIDLHIHGREERDVMDADPAALAVISASLARHGVTGFLATTVTTSWDRTLAALQVIGETDGNALPGARMLGAYSEGSFFNARHKGAHNTAYFLEPTPELIDQMIAATNGKLKVLALAPEINGAMETLSHATGRGIRVTLGHTDATYDQARAALAAGGCGGVHVFNGMRGIHHREPGCAGAVLLEPGMVEVIADGVHLHPGILQLIVRLKQADEVVLISDCMCAGGLDDGDYRLGEMDVTVKAGVVRTAGEGSLAGSTLTLDRAVMLMAEGAGIALREAVQMASLAPARFMGIDHETGSIAAGKRADLALRDPTGRIVATLVGGRLAWLDPEWDRGPALRAAMGAVSA